MKVENIMIGKQVSEHLYHFDQDITPEDLLKIIRHLAHRGRELGYLYDHNHLFYTKSDSIARQEFEYAYEYLNKNLDYLLDRYTRDELANRVSSAIKIVSSTTKGEIVQKVIKNKDFLFRFFKQDYIEKHCSRWHEFKRQKALLQAASDKSKYLVFSLSCGSVSLSGRNFLQYWRLGNKYKSLALDRNFKTEILGNDLTINLNDSDDGIIRHIRKFLKTNDEGKHFELSVEYKVIDTNDLGIKKVDPINYPLDIHSLTQYFGMRKGSKFKTFSEGLRQRKDSEIVERHLNKTFVIASDNEHIYCGIEHNRDFFEKIAWHLKIKYLKDKKILCNVTENETQETVTALWDILTGSRYSGAFCFIEI